MKEDHDKDSETSRSRKHSDKNCDPDVRKTDPEFGALDDSHFQSSQPVEAEDEFSNQQRDNG